MSTSAEKPKHFIEQRIEADIAAGTYPNGIVTRFPPEPSGYLHIGHAKAICIDFTMAAQYQGRCHLRFDDTNPNKEESEFSEAIAEDVKWLGFEWDALFYASSYFDQLYDFAITLIEKGLAYVCSLTPDEIRQYRGTLTEPGKNSPYRERSVAENLDLFARMKAGEFDSGQQVLRAKIDMASGNLNMRDPVIYRILHAKHPHLDEDWAIYPMYDFAHCLSDALEGITHSLCSLEFQDHRPLYDWFVEALFSAPRPQQIEFARLNLSHTLTSKRRLRELVESGTVEAWDDPRMPTLIGLRRRGFTPRAIRRFCQDIGLSKSDSVIDMSVLEEHVRDDLNQYAPRAVAVLNPLKVTLINYPVDQTETLTIPNHPQDEALGQRTLHFTRELFIEQDDFMENPPGKYKRLAPGKEVRLRHGYIIKCEEVIKNAAGKVIELRCSYDADTLGKMPPDRKVKGVIHWLSAKDAVPAEVRLYDRLFTHENPAQASNSLDELQALINPNSKEVLTQSLVEYHLSEAAPESRYQFERLGYFVIDRFDSTRSKPVLNRILNLRDTWQNKGE